MKKQVLILGLILFTSLIYSQTKVDSLVGIGIQYHDNGQYEKAIETYQTALEIEPNSPLINYEIAMTYMYANEYESSLKHSDIVIKQNDEHLLQAYIIKGSCLDYMGRTKESIKLFEKGLKKFGDNYLLYYNLGVNYYNSNEFDKAEQAFINAINTNSSHSSSHLLLGYLMTDKKQKVQSILCLHYFLYLEPNSERAKAAYELLQKQISGNVQRDKDKPDQINIFMDPIDSDSEFSAASMMISMLEASRSLEENEGKSDEELFVDNTTSFFNILGELKKKKNKGLWWDFYVPFFNDIADSEHIETYCYYISQSTNTNAQDWLKNNSEKVEQFDKWLKKNN